MFFSNFFSGILTTSLLFASQNIVATVASTANQTLCETQPFNNIGYSDSYAGAEVYYRCDPTTIVNYEYYRQNDNPLPNAVSGKYPEVILFPQTESDIVQALQIANEVGLRVCPRGGGHNYQGYSICDKGLLLDMRNFDQVNFLDDAKEFVEVEGGNILGNVYYKLVPENKTLPMGTCHGVGVGGHAQGGGYGFLARLHGLIIDRLVSARVILSNGTVVTASEKEESELFFAIRGGGGGNWGVITKFVFRTVEKPKMTIGIHQQWNGRNYSKAVVNAYVNKFKAHLADDRYTMRIEFLNNDISVNGMFSITEGMNNDVALAEVQKKMYDSFHEIPNPAVPWSKVSYKQTYEDSIRNNNGYNINVTLEELSRRSSPSPTNFGRLSSAMFANVSDALIEQMCDSFYASPTIPNGVMRFIQFDPLGGYFNTVPHNATAFPYREGTNYLMQIFSNFNDFTTQYTSEDAFVDSVKKAVEPFANGNYVNYIDSMDKVESYYGTNFDSLTLIKQNYDQLNMFSFPQEVPDNSTYVQQQQQQQQQQ